MKSRNHISVVLCAVVVSFVSGCVTGPKNLEPVKTPLPPSQLAKGLDAVQQQPELEPEWADYIKQHYPLWREHYWADRGQWGNRGYFVGGPATNAATAEAQATATPLPPAPTIPPAIVPIAPPVIVEAAPATKTTEPAEKKPTTYTVKKGDSLWRIAGRVYHNPFKWGRIYRANKDKIPNPNKIQPGMVLTIPQD